MKYLVYLFIFCTLPALGQNTGGIRVTVTDKYDKDPAVNVVVKLLQTQQTAVTDSTGTCWFYDLAPGSYHLQIYSDIDTSSIISLAVNTNELTFSKAQVLVNCQYKRNTSRICPICHKDDKVKEIAYGLVIQGSKRSQKKFRKKYYEGGCEVTGCDPKWYCERDKNKF